MVGRGERDLGAVGLHAKTQRRRGAEEQGSRGAGGQGCKGAKDLASLRGGGFRDLPGGAVGCLSPSLLY
jgi:hypothetical protein